MVIGCLLPLLHGGCTILQTSQSLFLASSLLECELCTSSSSPSLCSLDTMQSNLIKDALWGKEKAAAARGQHIKAEHQLQLSDQLYCKKNNGYCDKLEKSQFIQMHTDSMLCSESGHSTFFYGLLQQAVWVLFYLCVLLCFSNWAMTFNETDFPPLINAKYLNSI